MGAKRFFPTGWITIATLVGFFQILSGCEESNESPVAELSVINVKGPTRYACGGYIWAVKFTLAKPSPKGGYIIQEISTKRKATVNCPKVYKDIDITYYEAWKVNPGESVTYYIQNNPDDPEEYDDMFACNSWPESEGFENTAGNLRFFEDFKMTPDWFSNNPKTLAGELPSTLTKPAGWAAAAVKHNLDTDWKCCDGTAGGLTTDPAFPEIKGKIKEPAGGKFFEHVEPLKPWTDTSGYNLTDNQFLLQQAISLSALSDNEIMTGVVAYTDYYRDQIEDLSKLFLILRIVYNVPDSIPVAMAKTFGGWVKPVSELTGQFYKIAWPVASDPQNQPFVKYVYMGYMGAPYNAPGEAEYFVNAFGRRQ